MRCLVILIAAVLRQSMHPLWSGWVLRLVILNLYRTGLGAQSLVCLPRVRGQQGYISCIMSFTSKLLPPLSYGAYAKIRH